jgi:hypothetical protein
MLLVCLLVVFRFGVSDEFAGALVGWGLLWLICDVEQVPLWATG